MSDKLQLMNAMISATVRSEEAARLKLGDLVSALIALDDATERLKLRPRLKTLKIQKAQAENRVARVREEAKRFLEQGRV